MTDNEIKKRIKVFKGDVKNVKIPLTRLVDKYIVFGTPYVFSDKEELYYELKEEIAEFFKVRPSCAFMVGSCKLGFSIKPTQLWKHITQESDIDMTIIDAEIFDKYWISILEYNNKVRISAITIEEQKVYKSFLKYFFKGWIRPDLIPFSNPLKENWDTIVKQLYNKYDDRKTSVGIFRNEHFFENYHLLNIEKIRKSL